MGWASGSQLAEEVWEKFKKYIPEKDHAKMAKWLVDAFEDYDGDDWDYDEDSLHSIAYPDGRDY